MSFTRFCTYIHSFIYLIKKCIHFSVVIIKKPSRRIRKYVISVATRSRGK